MIFDTNRTSLGSSVPMAEGYDCATGAAKALIESARNDYAMFRAMLDADARELSLRTSGYVSESEVMSLQEAVGGSIWKKIADLFKKLIAKIKSIFANFVAKFRGLYMKDKDLVKKYGNKIMRKSNLGNMEIKWRKTKNSYNETRNLASKQESTNFISIIEDLASKEWNSDIEKRWSTITSNYTEINKKCANASEVREKLEEDYWEDATKESYKFDEIFTSGSRELVSSFDGFGKSITEFEKSIKKVILDLDKKVKEYDKIANELAKYSRDFKNLNDNQIKSHKVQQTVTNKNGSGQSIEQTDVDTKDTQDYADKNAQDASHTYDMAVVANDVILVVLNYKIEIVKELYKQTKAVFIKAVTVNDKKLEESAVYADFIAETAENEVEDVISNAIDSDGRDTLASTTVADQDLIDTDDYELGYHGSKYSDDCIAPKVDGCKDSTIVGTKESSIFSDLLY